MVFDGFDTDPEPFGDLPVRETLIAAHLEDAASLIRHFLYGDGDQQGQIVRLHLAVERIVEDAADGGTECGFVSALRQRVVVNIEDGIFQHREEVV